MKQPKFFARNGSVFASSQWGGMFLTPGDVDRMIASWSVHPEDRDALARAVCDDLLSWLLKASDEAAQQYEMEIAA